MIDYMALYSTEIKNWFSMNSNNETSHRSSAQIAKVD